LATTMRTRITGYERQLLGTSWGSSIFLGPQTTLMFWVNHCPMKPSTIWWNPYCFVFRSQDGENLSKTLPTDIFSCHVFTRMTFWEKVVFETMCSYLLFVIC
jgi:hypothetical protein